MQRDLIITSYLLVMAMLAACTSEPLIPSPDSTAAPPTISEAPLASEPTLAPTRAPIPTHTLTPTLTATPIPAAISPLLVEVRQHIDEAQPIARDRDIWRYESGPNSTCSEYEAQESARQAIVKTWVNNWLGQFSNSNTVPQARLNDYELLETNLVDYHPTYYEEFIYVESSFRLKPARDDNSWWMSAFNLADTGGWVLHDGLFFTFQLRDDFYVLTDIHLKHPLDFSYTLNTVEFNGLSDDAIISELMDRWFASYMSTDIAAVYRLDYYSIDEVHPEIRESDHSTFVVTFSAQNPALADATGPAWSSGRFSGKYDYDSEIRHKMLRYVGIRHEEDMIVFESLDQPPQYPQVMVLKSELGADTPEEIGRALIQKYMASLYVGPNIVNAYKLLDYRVESITLQELEEPQGISEDYFALDLEYSVLPYMPLGAYNACPSWACEGEWDKATGWVNKLWGRFTLERREDSYHFIHTWNGCCVPPPPPWATPQR